MTFWEALAFVAPRVFLPWVIFTLLRFYLGKIESEDRFIKAILYLSYWLVEFITMNFILFGIFDLDGEAGSLITAIFNNIAAVLLPVIIYLVTKRRR